MALLFLQFQKAISRQIYPKSERQPIGLFFIGRLARWGAGNRFTQLCGKVGTAQYHRYRRRPRFLFTTGDFADPL